MDAKFRTLVSDSVNARIVAECGRHALDRHIVDVNEEGAIEIGPRDQTDLQPLLEIGARQVEAGQEDLSWIVLADPEATNSARFASR